MSYVAMEKAVCPLCGIVHDSGAILLHKQLRDIPELGPTTVQLCEECDTNVEAGYIGLVEIVEPDGGETLKWDNAYRTGHIIFVRKEKAEEIFGMEINCPFIFAVEPMVRNMISEYSE